jgi:hypothetical protein
VLVGVFLLAVPTVFTVIPRWLRDVTIGWRLAILGAWALGALLVVLNTVIRDRAWDDLVSSKHDQRRALRLTATRDVLRALMAPGSKAIPIRYEFTLYLYDDSTDTLKPVHPTTRDALGDGHLGDDPRVFKAGTGATGTAWTELTTVVVTGAAVSDGRYGLTQRQCQHFGQYECVVATPVLFDNEPLGVLTAISRTHDGFFDDDPGKATLRELAGTIGVVLTAIPEPGDFL